MRIEPGTDAHYVLVAAERRSLPSEFFDTMPDPAGLLYEPTRTAIADTMTAGLIVHDEAGSLGSRPGYLLTDEGRRALQSILDTGYYDNAHQ
jgi:hypothetical protein